MMDIISVSLSTIFLLSLRIFFLSENLWFHVKRLQINQKNFVKRRLRFRENISGYVSMVLYGGSDVRWPERPNEPFCGELRSPNHQHGLRALT